VTPATARLDPTVATPVILWLTTVVNPMTFKCLVVVTPETATLPRTSKVELGFVVPIPRLPFCKNLAHSVAPDPNAIP